MRRKSMANSLCAMERTLDVVGDWWSLLIIRDAIGGATRFSEFQRSLGVARNILTTRLKSLVAADVLEIFPTSDGSAHQEYVVTDKGRDLLTVLVAMAQWGSEHVCERCPVPVDSKKGRPLKKLELQAQDGSVLKLQEVLICSFRLNRSAKAQDPSCARTGPGDPERGGRKF
jgi:DNA-binding HxlR family transcriptional regulator